LVYWGEVGYWSLVIGHWGKMTILLTLETLYYSLIGNEVLTSSYGLSEKFLLAITKVQTSLHFRNGWFVLLAVIVLAFWNRELVPAGFAGLFFWCKQVCTSVMVMFYTV
jgi:hypothetical protein